ncbi:co-chaperone protein p23-1 [Daucus carota subsp. sativus]|uniref:co-chaperone protein p23-1 n=1 Tax=Daucus carota subsp. sativus TaxID=79200 RepID=UPI0007EFB1F3|nr:PREDICTED: uncharacterized protein OsI_027940-like isoform X1 [Daucus carota subsp. sativus]
MTRHPTIKWAQRSDVLYITIELPDAEDVNTKLEPEGRLYFSATSGPDNLLYEVDIDLYDKVDVDESMASTNSRNFVYILKKVESKWWSRLLKKEGKPPAFLKVDWNKWVDEDEQDEEDESNINLDDFNFSGLKLGGSGEDHGNALDDDNEGDDGSDTEEEIKDDEAPATGKAEPNDEEEPTSTKP